MSTSELHTYTHEKEIEEKKHDETILGFVFLVSDQQ